MKASGTIRMSCLLAMTFVVSACSTVPDRPYHRICDEKNCTAAQLGKAVPLVATHYVSNFGWDADKVSSRSRVPTSFYKAWLEYNEKGEPFLPDQKLAILKRMREINNSGNRILLIVYVHGWHNNADDRGKDKNYDAIAIDELLAKSTDSVRRMFEQSNKAGTPVVMGIFVGWRGETTKVPVFTALSISDRSKAADRLGRGKLDNPNLESDLRSDLKEISDAAYSLNRDNRSIIMGHSLGGRALTSAFLDDVASRGFAINPGVMVVTFNAAVNADCYSSAFKANRPSQIPSWINFTSDNDTATKNIYKDAVVYGFIDSCSSDGVEGPTAIGHYEKYLTERLHFIEHLKEGRLNGPTGNTGTLSDGRVFENVMVNATNWHMAKSIEGVIAYKHLDITRPENALSRRYDKNSADMYRMSLVRTPSFPEPMLIRNISTDRTAINRADEPDTVSAYHNAFISTNLIRLVIEASYGEILAH